METAAGNGALRKQANVYKWILANCLHQSLPNFEKYAARTGICGSGGEQAEWDRERKGRIVASL